jgi:hypothetical protein
MEFVDTTGQPRRDSEVQEALDFVSKEMVRHPLAMSPDGFPYTIHFSTIRAALRELLDRRAKDPK